MLICKICGSPQMFRLPYTLKTLVAFISPPGHDHDDNCITRGYRCKNGHFETISVRRRCPVEGCDWVGRESCFCHQGKKVDQWPDAPELDLSQPTAASP